MGKVIRVNREALTSIVYLSRKKMPIEANGILAGSKSSDSIIVNRTIELTNALRSFNMSQIDTAEYMWCKKILSQNNENLVGFFHSHPLAATIPSKEDKVAMRTMPGIVTIICSVHKDGSYDVDAYMWEKGMGVIKLLVETF